MNNMETGQEQFQNSFSGLFSCQVLWFIKPQLNSIFNQFPQLIYLNP